MQLSVLHHLLGPRESHNGPQQPGGEKFKAHLSNENLALEL